MMAPAGRGEARSRRRKYEAADVAPGRALVASGRRLVDRLLLRLSPGRPAVEAEARLYQAVQDKTGEAPGAREFRRWLTRVGWRACVICGKPALERRRGCALHQAAVQQVEWVAQVPSTVGGTDELQHYEGSHAG